MISTENSSFLKSIARYFMDFLETDFHRRRVPRRSVKLKNESGQLLGISIDKYPGFDNEIWNVVSRKFDDGGAINIQKNQYRASIPANLKELLAKQVEALKPDAIEAVQSELLKGIKNYSISLKDEYSKAEETIESETLTSVEKYITGPLIESVEKSLLLLETADENTAYQIKIELTEQLTAMIMPVAKTMLQDAITQTENMNLEKSIKSAISIKSTKSLLNDYFDDLSANDMHQELAEIEGNRLILDKQELYLYFCDITYQNTKYPIFYVPAVINRSENGIRLEFDSKIYLNKKAIEYIAQEYGNEDKSVSGNPIDFDRIMYLTAYESGEAFTNRLKEILDHFITYFDTRGELLLAPERTISRNQKIKLTNTAYFSLFDKADEALINDYEQILDMDLDSELFAEFEKIVSGFITDEPKDVSTKVEANWDEMDSTEKLSFESPVPLNGEQLQIINALNEEECRFVTVEGPPGTGKSHTITALVFSAILNNQSVLVLSDKKEALDVVEEKITETLNHVRFGSDFQNPILRLGGVNNFRQILSSTAVDNIKLQHKLTGKRLDELEGSIQTNLEVTREQVRNEIESYQKINKADLRELENLEKELSKSLNEIDVQELLDVEDIEVQIHEIREIYERLCNQLNDNSKTIEIVRSLRLFSLKDVQSTTIKNLMIYMQVVGQLVAHVESLQDGLQTQGWSSVFEDFNDISDSDLQELGQYILKLESLKKPIVGFAFNKTRANAGFAEFNARFNTNFIDPSTDLKRIKTAHTAFTQLSVMREHLPFTDNIKERIDYLNLISKLLAPNTLEACREFSLVYDDLAYLDEVCETLPANFGDIEAKTLIGLRDFALLGMDNVEAEKIMRWLHLMSSVNILTNSVPFYSYRQYMETVQKQVSLRMAQILDGRLIDFYTQSKATATVIKDIIKAKQKFPKDSFSKLKDAFPCILAGIREYGDYIPLEVGIFDLVIIDEASQVSVAQAFPALIRGKKVVVMGDRLQFGNVKSYQARSEINTEYQQRLKETFKRTVADDIASLKKIERLNVKKSILDFSEYISNYQIMLRKHFRSYPENISFSNKYFYQNALQVMKIRGKNIDDVLKFTQIKHDGKTESRPNTNQLEIDFILSELRKKAEAKDKTQSIGIITPHTNQQRYLFEQLRKEPHFDFYVNELKLKVMTFDTCQGEERDIIYYSMVASEIDDKLAYVFPRDIFQNNFDNDSESEVRRQRLNVGFSRSKETMHFIISKPVEQFNGSIGVALNHYATLKEEVARRLTADAVDKNSPMEKKVLDWVYQTPFWSNNTSTGRCELHAQFELGEYLKQLDPTYHHPKFVVDFILIYTDEGGRSYKIIIEYDGFNEHTDEENRQYVDGSNFESYLKEDDIYRQKVLESYGYEFIRLNKFNVGSNPVEYINERITKLVDGSMISNSVGHDIDAIIRGQALGLFNGDLKECKNCGRVIPVQEFKDSSLSSGIGRVCKDCKNTPKPMTIRTKKSKPASKQTATGMSCPRCNKRLMRRSGRYGDFLGCSGFPYCKYTRNA